MGKGNKRVASPELEVFHVEVITQARVVPMSSDEDDDDGSDSDSDTSKKKKTAKWEYLVKWAGYDSSADSWEPESNVAGCQRLLHSFWDHIGTDNRDYSIGHTVVASDKWIKREKKYFAVEFNNEQEKLRLRREKEERGYGAKEEAESVAIYRFDDATSCRIVAQGNQI